MFKFLLLVTVGLACAGALGLVASLSGASSGSEARASSGGSSPFDPLSADEIDTVFSAVEASTKFPAGAFFPGVVLKEAKSATLGWKPGQPFSRQAVASVFDPVRNKLFEAVVDLRAGKLVSWVERPNTQPPVYTSEYQEVDDLVRADPRWRKAMKDRGIKPDDVYLDDGWAVGGLTVPGVKPGTRLLRALSFYRGSLPNPYDRPIEGVVVTVDMNRMLVAQVIDSGIHPVNKTISGDADRTRAGLKPLVTTQPKGPSFQIVGNAVSWQGWHFRVSYSQHEGLVLYEVGYEQKGKTRPIIHRLALDEIFNPYANPDPNWAWRGALDVGEYFIGQWAAQQESGLDVPENSVFLDEVAASDLGSAGDPPAFDLPAVVAIYERNAGTLWERTDPTSLERDARFARELVVTTQYPFGNYTYMTEYIFRMDGGIDVRAGATGTTLNQGVDSVAEGNQFGTSVTPNIAAPSHQHFFNFRIDFDVDGTNNRVVEEDQRSVSSSSGNAFVTDEIPITTERFRDAKPSADRRWVVQSTTKTNALGEPTGYELHPLDLTQPYADPGSDPLQRAVFAKHALWVTEYQDDELYAAGTYPNQSSPGQGLPSYVSDQANVNGRDLVVWFSASFTHHPAVEEFPVMTTETVGFSIRPDGFFDENPALDAP